MLSEGGPDSHGATNAAAARGKLKRRWLKDACEVQ